MKTLRLLFKQYTGVKPLEIFELSASGSNRQYYRLKNEDNSVIGVVGTSPEENKAFYYMSNHFKSKGLNVPQVYLHNNSFTHYIQEDLGDAILFDFIKKGRLTRSFSEDEKLILRKTIEALPAMQFKAAEDFDFSMCYPQPDFNERSVLWDLNYFKYCFLKAVGMEFQENRLEDDFIKMARVLLEDDSNTFLYRDFQSRNVMIKDDEPYFIDFQGGRRGPVYYDVASFLWQAKANFTDELRAELIDAYIAKLRKFIKVDKKKFSNKLRHFVLFRTLQVLGAYGFRGYFEKKPHFIQSVPFAVENVRHLLQAGYPEYPYLCEVLHMLTELKQFSTDIEDRRLEVSISSFSYKKGLPNDTSGNGGGYVFDCRAINNPGKYERYNAYTGLDDSVIKFFEEDGEMPMFLENIYKIVDASVKRYIERRFTNLMVCFGCTGGQHRSVYAAQHLAEHLNKKFGVKVNLVHREQNIEQIFKAKR